MDNDNRLKLCLELNLLINQLISRMGMDTSRQDQKGQPGDTYDAHINPENETRYQQAHSSSTSDKKPKKGYARIAKSMPELKSQVKITFERISKSENQVFTKLQKFKDTEKYPYYYVIYHEAYYQGDFKQGVAHGFGHAIFKNGEYYIGNFEQGKPNDDNAIIILADGSLYEGCVINTLAHGFGKMQYKQGKGLVYYEGEWDKARPHGKGRQQYNALDYYDGEFNQGVKKGRGTYVWDNGNFKYSGMFQNGLFHGKGTIYSIQDYQRESEVFSGTFVKGEKNGEGKIYTANGTLEGLFQGDYIDGEGQFTWKDGKKYVGGFKQNQFHGNGKIYHPSGQIVEGIFKDGQNQLVSRLKRQSG